MSLRGREVVSISMKDVTKRFDGVTACDHITLGIEEGELFTLLGPSGCGKTTALRVIAGFYYPDEGSVFFDDQDITGLPPHRRQTGMVFQNYALWPHMNVFDNIAYGLKVRRTSKGETKRRVEKILELVHLEGLGPRTPFQLSGGQQQRVALARALVIEPKVLLLDEPLSNLDAKLRLEMRHEIIRIQKQLAITAIYVTHDQEEALTISDRVAIMNEGRIEQVGSPSKVYAEPQNVFVTDFIGQCNFLPGKIEKVNKYLRVITDAGTSLQGVCPNSSVEFKPGRRVLCAVRPEKLLVAKPESEYNTIKGLVLDVVFVGKANKMRLRVGDQIFLADVDPVLKFKRGGTVSLYSRFGDTMIFPLEERDHLYLHDRGKSLG